MIRDFVKMSLGHLVLTLPGELFVLSSARSVPSNSVTRL